MLLINSKEKFLTNGKVFLLPNNPSIKTNKVPEWELYLFANIIDNRGINKLREIIIKGRINLVTKAALLLSSPKSWYIAP